jgi:hypothetical protein
MKRVPIDKLLQWAINDELPKGHHVMQDVRRIIERAAEFDRPRAKRRYIPPARLTGGYVAGEPHPDALVIAQQLWHFSVCISLPNEAAARALLGPLADLDPESIRVALGVRIDVAALMITCAALKRPPQLPIEHPKPRPVHPHGDRRRILVQRRDANDKLIPASAVHWNGARHPASYYGEPRCPISWEDPTIPRVARRRAEYAIWWGKMTMLQRQLVGRLRQHEATPLECSLRPWLVPPASAPRVLKPGDGVVLDKDLPPRLAGDMLAGPAPIRSRPSNATLSERQIGDGECNQGISV